jgi:predicted CoA-binding protein
MKNEKNLVKEIITNSHNIAVIGIKKTEIEPAYDVPLYMFNQGYHIYPVNPKLAGEILFGEKTVSNIMEIKHEIDLVIIFRRSEFVYGHAEEILKMEHKPRYAWFQEGIYDNEAAQLLNENGISVIQDRCIMIDHEKMM